MFILKENILTQYLEIQRGSIITRSLFPILLMICNLYPTCKIVRVNSKCYEQYSFKCALVETVFDLTDHIFTTLVAAFLNL